MRLFVVIGLSASALVAQNGATRENWPHYGGTQYSWRYSALDQINAANIKRLVPAWVYQTGDYEMGLQSTPIVIDGTMYVSTSRNQIHALDAATGRVLWIYRYPVPRGPVPYGPQNRGVAIGDGKVFIGTWDNSLVAVDQKIGREVWRVNLEDVKQCGCNITAAPLIVKDKVVVGQSGGDSAHRGYLTAFDMKTGRLAWRFYAIPGPGEPGHETWKGDSWKFGGGAPWMTGSFDSGLNLVIWGMGNAAADNYADSRTGSNLYTGSVVALDADTGRLKWHYQEIPQDVWDFDSAYECVLVDLPVNGQIRKLVVHVNKSGHTFVLDRENGRFLRAFPINKYSNWAQGITEDGKIVGRRDPVVGKPVMICPSVAGGKSWNQMAYSPLTKWVYVPAIEWCNDIIARPQEPEEGRGFIGGTWITKHPPGDRAHSHLDAWNPVTGQKMWTYNYKYSLMASVLTTAGNLVFSGDPEGFFFALDARTGEKLWSFQTGAGHRGSSVTYAVKGRQYVATPTGWGSLAAGSSPALWPEAENFRPGSSVFVFALPESAR
jgi:alcohol dehydrogenase (cytochrome c)